MTERLKICKNVDDYVFLHNYQSKNNDDHIFKYMFDIYGNVLYDINMFDYNMCNNDEMVCLMMKEIVLITDFNYR